MQTTIKHSKNLQVQANSKGVRKGGDLGLKPS